MRSDTNRNHESLQRSAGLLINAHVLDIQFHSLRERLSLTFENKSIISFRIHEAMDRFLRSSRRLVCIHMHPAIALDPCTISLRSGQPLRSEAPSLTPFGNILKYVARCCCALVLPHGTILGSRHGFVQAVLHRTQTVWCSDEV